MRPVNLIPLEDRHGQNAPLRTGPVAYILIGALVLALAGVTALVLTGNQISDRKSELAQVKREDAAATARAESLAPYAQFAALHEQRVATISSLADSRFDWERVMRELALILPHDVWLVSLDATASAEAGGSDSSSEGGSIAGSIAGPSLAISGCAAGQEAVAGFVTVLKDIEGVTRVGVESSELPSQEEGAGSASGSESGEGGGSSDCRTRSFISQFSIAVAFDAAPVPVTGSEESAPVSATEKSEASAEEVSGESSEEGSEGG
jgi:Tfp pilus assembly protein PilN